MSQQQAIQPIVLKQENGEVVLKLVLESPKQETQTLILQQPDGKEFTMSTDKTAIESFWLAMIIALILATSATIVAIWYGRKSFNLTEMGFDITKGQIKSSQQLILKSNSELIEAHNNNKLLELRFLYKHQEINKLQELIADYFSIIMTLNNSLAIKVGLINEENFDRKKEFMEDVIKEINQYGSKMISFSFQIELYLDVLDNEEHKIISDQLAIFNKSIWNIIGNLGSSKKEIIQSITEFSFKFDDIKDSLTKMVIQEIKKIKGE